MPSKKRVNCGHTNVYKATRKPRCKGGNGCPACWEKWYRLHPEMKLKAEIDPIPDEYVMASQSSWNKTNRMKRQEYNRTMGKVAELAHTVAADPEGTDSAVSRYLSNLAEDEQRWINRRRARSVSLEMARDILFFRQFEEMSKRVFKSAIAPAGYALKGGSKELKRYDLLHLSDLHIGARLPAEENPRQFGPAEEARGLAWLTIQAIEFKPQYRNNTTLKLLLNGDLIEGLLLHDLRDGAPLAEQCVAFLQMMRQVIGLLARNFPRVEIHCQSGNHGRNKLRHEGRATVSKWDSYETILYKSLEMMSCDLKNVSWDIPKAPWCVIPVFDKWMLQTHGDTELKLGPPGKQAALYEVALNQMNSNMTYGHHIDLLVNGHFHEPRLMPFRTATAMTNGALVPDNGHARSLGYTTVRGQWLWEAVPGHVVGDTRYIHLGPDQDKDAGLDKYVTPVYGF